MGMRSTCPAWPSVVNGVVRVLDRPGHGLTLLETVRALTGDRSLAAKLLTAPELPADVHRSARRWLGIS